jgi:hypothetical protein
VRELEFGSDTPVRGDRARFNAAISAARVIIARKGRRRRSFLGVLTRKELFGACHRRDRHLPVAFREADTPLGGPVESRESLSLGKPSVLR